MKRIHIFLLLILLAAAPSSFARKKTVVTSPKLEWWDPREGKLPNPDVQYPQLSKAALFVCTSRTCSSPIYSPDRVQGDVGRLMNVNKQVVAGK